MLLNMYEFFKQETETGLHQLSCQGLKESGVD